MAHEVSADPKLSLKRYPAEKTHKVMQDGIACFANYSSVGKAGEKQASAKRKTKKKHLGGWRSTKALEWRDVKQIVECEHTLKTHGLVLNIFCTINAPKIFISDQERKRFCYRKLDNIRLYLKRRGYPFLCIRVFEKTCENNLHLHALLHVPRSLHDELVGTKNEFQIDIRVAKSIHVNYITKMRKTLPPNLESQIRHIRKKGLAFKGRRWSFSKELSSLLAALKARKMEK